MCYLFLKSCVDLSLLLIYNPLEMVIHVMQHDFEGLGIWPLETTSAGTVHMQSHFSVLKACNSPLLSPPGTSQFPVQFLWL